MISAMVCESNTTKPYKFTYDANGNLTKECFHTWPEVTYQYDTENRLKAVSNTQELLMAAVYDGDGNRAFQLNYNTGAVCGYGKNMSGEVYIPAHNKNEDGSLTAEGELFSYICSETGRSYDLIEYVNDTTQEYTQVLEAYTINSGAAEAYTYGNGRVSRNNYWIEARDVTHNEMSYYLYDGRGSVTGNTWYNGMVTDVYQYDPYGKVTLGSTEHTEFYGYNAESYNPNTGLEYLRVRYYNPNKGRFFQEDSYLGNITDPLTLNRYAYTKNSPLNYIDPSGNDIAIYKFGTGYSLLPDNKVENIILGLSGFVPYVDSCIVNIDTWLMNKQVEEFEYVDESDEFEQSLSYISTLATTVSLMSLAMEFPVISKVSGDVANLLTVTKLMLTLADRSPYISQITYHLFSPYLILVNTKENLLNRYKAFYNYVEELIDSGALTYTTFFCNVIEDSIIIIDPDKYKEVTKDVGFDLNRILNQYS